MVLEDLDQQILSPRNAEPIIPSHDDTFAFASDTASLDAAAMPDATAAAEQPSSLPLTRDNVKKHEEYQRYSKARCFLNKA